MDDIYLRKVMATVIVLGLLVLSFLLIKPILISIIVALILAFVFSPVYEWLYKVTKLKNISAFLICILLISLIVLPFWFLAPIFIDQSVKVYLASQQMDFVAPLKKIFPSLFASDQFSEEIGSIIKSFVSRMANYLTNFFSQLIVDFPTLFLQFVVVIFSFFFILRDKEELADYIKSLLPFSKDVETKLFKYSKDITSSVLYGQVIIGFLQGIFVGIGLFIFQVPNALFLTLFACIASIMPLLGPVIIWVPVVIYLYITGDATSALGITVFGLIASTIDNFLRPMIVSKKTHLHSSIVLIGMVGGAFLFGILGFILGPLILSYLLIILEIYRNRKTSGIFIQQA